LIGRSSASARSLFALLELLGRQQLLPPRRRHRRSVRSHCIGPPKKMVYTGAPPADMQVEVGANFDVDIHGVDLNHIPAPLGDSPVTSRRGHYATTTVSRL
jgi:hypothetical protein